MKNIIYRNANLDDALGIQYVSAYSWKETYTGLLPEKYLDDRIENLKLGAERTKSFLENYKGNYIVAVDNDINKIVGILAYMMEESCGHIDAIYVLKDYQGYGIGKKLFEIAFDDFNKNEINKVKLECMCGNNTTNFYKKYNGNIIDTIDYPIGNVCTVKADVFEFNNVDEVLKLIKNRK